MMQTSYSAALCRAIIPATPRTALVNAQDHVVQVGQGAIIDRARERLGKSHEGVIFLRKISHRELAAIKAGKSPKRWMPNEEFSRLPVPPNIPKAPDRLRTASP